VTGNEPPLRLGQCEPGSRPGPHRPLTPTSDPPPASSQVPPGPPYRLVDAPVRASAPVLLLRALCPVRATETAQNVPGPPCGSSGREIEARHNPLAAGDSGVSRKRQPASCSSSPYNLCVQRSARNRFPPSIQDHPGMRMKPGTGRIRWRGRAYLAHPIILFSAGRQTLSRKEDPWVGAPLLSVFSDFLLLLLQERPELLYIKHVFARKGGLC